MPTDPATGIRILDATLDYSDSSEDRVLATLAEATDRSSVSDELASAMVDWPTRYHFSRMRGHLVRPLTLRPGLEVLDVGCGTGAVTRALGERKVRVFGIEGALPRARAAALRCADLENVEIACGDISHFETDRTFDLACLIGVLEYAGAAEGGKHGPESLLAKLRGLVRPDGALLIAIENQLGLKYLLGYREDHVGLPWAGIEDYSEGFGARTWSRRELARLLASAGFAAQRWFYPFPDYKLPTVILSESAFERTATTELVDQVVRRPVHDFAYPRTVLTDDRRVHRVLLDAGLGPDVANSFLVLATAEENHLDAFADPTAIAWIMGGERRALWKRTQVVSTRGDELRVTAQANSGGNEDRSEHWLTQVPERDDPWYRGPTFEQLILQDCHRRDEVALSSTLAHWVNVLEDVLTPAPPRVDSHPFSPVAGEKALPDDMLDVSPSNFLLTDNGVEFVDREWRVEGGVDLGLAGLRALWFLALDIVHGGARHPWSDDLTVDEISCRMASICGLPAQPADLERMYGAEAELQSLVIGFDRERVLRDLRESGHATLSAPAACCATRWTHLHELAASSAAVSVSDNDEPRTTTRDQATTASDVEPTLLEEIPAEGSADRLHARLEDAQLRTEDLEARLSEAQDQVREHEQTLTAQRRKLENLRAKNQRLENLAPVRIYNRLRWWLSGR